MKTFSLKAAQALAAVVARLQQRSTFAETSLNKRTLNNNNHRLNKFGDKFKKAQFLTTNMDYLMQLYTRFFTGGNGAGSNTFSAPKIVCFGNVLLDRTAQLTDTKLLERFQLELETKEELDAETLSRITAEVCECLECRSNPGGSALNSVRILRQLGTDVVFFGAVGEDKDAEELHEILRECGVEARLQRVPDAPTGQCICLVHNETTTLLANIGASSKFSVDFLRQAERDGTQTRPFLRPIERKQILYMEGFFVPQREAVIQYIVKQYIHERRRLALNLSAVYIVQQNYDQLLFLARNSFFIFGNRNEFQALCEQMQCESFEDMARALIAGGAIKIIIITKGAEGVELITNFIDEYSKEAGDLTFHSFMAPRVDEVVDTTGAGDSFVAGFLHAFLEKRSLSECVRVAGDVASKVVTQIGCNLP